MDRDILLGQLVEVVTQTILFGRDSIELAEYLEVVLKKNSVLDNPGIILLCMVVKP